MIVDVELHDSLISELRLHMTGLLTVTFKSLHVFTDTEGVQDEWDCHAELRLSQIKKLEVVGPLPAEGWIYDYRVTTSDGRELAALDLLQPSMATTGSVVLHNGSRIDVAFGEAQLAIDPASVGRRHWGD